MTHRAEEGLSFESPSEVDLAYLAGLIDGEGHFAIGPRFKPVGRNSALPAIRIAMIDQAPLLWCHERFGGKFSLRGRAASGSVVYEWILNRQEDLRYLLPLLLPHLKLKGSQAWALMRVVETLAAQPRHAMPTSHLALGSRVLNRSERERRGCMRDRWRYDVARAQQSVLEARLALKEGR